MELRWRWKGHRLCLEGSAQRPPQRRALLSLLFSGAALVLSALQGGPLLVLFITSVCLLFAARWGLARWRSSAQLLSAPKLVVERSGQAYLEPWGLPLEAPLQLSVGAGSAQQGGRRPPSWALRWRASLWLELGARGERGLHELLWDHPRRRLQPLVDEWTQLTLPISLASSPRARALPRERAAQEESPALPAGARLSEKRSPLTLALLTAVFGSPGLCFWLLWAHPLSSFSLLFMLPITLLCGLIALLPVLFTCRHRRLHRCRDGRLLLSARLPLFGAVAELFPTTALRLESARGQLRLSLQLPAGGSRRLRLFSGQRARSLSSGSLCLMTAKSGARGASDRAETELLQLYHALCPPLDARTPERAATT